ncbi:hypothetical protein ACFXJO_05570 [Streptomyces lavendulae]|uniref:hypothetical protein n=1 Tax=Streptomyces lavendulae TaxID=1914 RepID=UPI00367D89C5
MSSDHRSWQERDAEAEAIRVQTATLAADAEADRRRREALDEPKIAAAKARAEEIAREAAAKARAAQQAEADEREAKEKARDDALVAEQAERRRRAEVAKRDAKAAKAVKYFAVACFLVALPLQLRAFWSPGRPWEMLAPLVLESAAWVMMRQAEAAIAARRTVWQYLVGAGVAASIAAGINVYDGATHANIGLTFGLVGGFCSLAGPAVWAVHEFGARAKAAKATRAERKLAEQQAKQAEAELEAVKITAEADLKAKQLEADTRRQIETDKRTAHEEKVAADKAAVEAELAAQDAQRKTLFPKAWEQYERILAAHPIGQISRDRAWDEARRATDHPDVWDRYQVLLLNSVNVKATDLWADAWVTVKGLPVGQTIESLAAKLAAREYVNQTLAEHMDAAGHLAVEELLAGIFGGGGDGGGTPAKGAPRKPHGGPSKGSTALVNIGPEGDTAPRYKHDTDPLTEADLTAARKLYEAAPEQFSTPAVAKLLGRSPNYAKRVRDAVKNPKEGNQ